MKDILFKLTNNNHKAAHEFTKEIIFESTSSDKYLNLIPSLLELLKDENSYVRTRAFTIICAQARWAKNGQIESVFNQMLPLLNDSKPTVVRQCLNALHEVVLYRPELSDKVRKALSKIDLSKYQDGMSSLIEKDIILLQSKL